MTGAPAQPWGILSQHLAEPGSAFVFPSEVTARFWARRALELGSCRTVTLDRFLSWDELKARLLSYPEGRRPVNRAARLLFLCRFLEDNRHSARLQRLVPRERAAAPLSYLASLESILPALHHASRLSWPETSGGKRKDLLLLYREYSRHLEAAGRYEPAWERPELREDGRRFWIFWPELIEDYGEFAGLLERASWLHTVPVPPLPAGASRRSGEAHAEPEARDVPPQPPVRSPERRRAPAAAGAVTLQAHSTLSEELKALLAEAAALLDGGVAPEQIAITVGDLPEIEEELLRQAELYQVPLVVRHGRPLDRFPVTRLFSRLFACPQSGMSLSTLRALLLDRAIPWKQERLGRALVRLGVEGKVLANRGDDDAWLDALRALRTPAHSASDPLPGSVPLARMEGYYRSLERAIRAAALSAGFRQLKDRLAVLAGEFLDLSRWSREEMEVYQFCLNSLDDLEAESEAAPAPADLPAWRIWLHYLGSLRYVPRRAAGGIPVYPYRLAEGICPQHHLLAGISQAATLHRLRRYPFLAVHEEEGLADARVDLSAGHLRLYCHSGLRVSFHYARRRRGRSHLPPAFFVAAGLADGQPMPSPPAPDAYEAEALAWAGGRLPLQGSLLEAQARGYAVARAAVLQERPVDAARGRLQDTALVEQLFSRLTGEGGQLRLSATALESFTACPLRFLFERSLNLGRETYEPLLEDPRDVGRVLHAVVQRFFTGLLKGGVDALAPAQAEAYRASLQEAVAVECRLFESRNPATLRPLWQALRSRVLELAEAYLESELSELAGERTLRVEAWLQAPLPSGQAVLVGQVDRIAAGPAAACDDPVGAETGGTAPGAHTLVEYKKNRVPTRPAVFGPEPTSFQVPLYAHLMQSQGYPISRALYYSFEQKRFKSLLRAGNEADRRDLAAAMASVLQRLQAMSERLRQGDFRIGSADAFGAADTFGYGTAGGCSHCPFPALCRTRYVVEP